MAMLRIFRRVDAAAVAVLDLPPDAAAPALAHAEARPAGGFARGIGPAAGASRPLPAALAAYRPIRAEQLDAAGRHALAKLCQKIPRPPAMLAELLDPAQATDDARALAQRLGREPALARAIAQPREAVAGPPPAVLAGAIDRLGVCPARQLAIRWMLQAVFVSDCPQRRVLLAAAWQASTLACEIAAHLAARVRLARAPALVDATALSFVGRLATIASMPKGLLERVPPRGCLERLAAEQALLGVSSSEIGRLLMLAWDLPRAVVDEAAEVDAVLFAPHAAWEPARAARLALCYLSARCGERLVADPTLDLADIDPMGDPDAEFHQLRGYLAGPAQAGLAGALRDGALREALRHARSMPQPPD